MAHYESLDCTLYPRPERRGFTVGGVIKLLLTIQQEALLDAKLYIPAGWDK